MPYSILASRFLRCMAALCASTGCFLGCGGSDDSTGTQSSGYTLDTVCDDLAPKVCQLRSPCCTAAGIGFDEAGCENDFKTQCNADVTAVNSGDETFDPSGLDACLAKLPDIFAKCTLTLTDVLTVTLDLRACNAFAGKKGEGAACTRNSECAQSADANTFTSCDDQTHTCSKLTVAKQGDGCDATKKTYCGLGLYCDAPALMTAGTCKSATPTGQACQRPAITNPECGIGSYCDGTNATCAQAKAAREACTLPGECASGQCTNGSCAVGTPFVKAPQCGK